MNKFELNEKVSIEFESPKNASFKFGYYNYCPINFDGTKLLAHKINFEGRMPNEDDTVEIGFFDLKSQKWIPLQTSKAFNWQQGSMLQWLGPDFNDRIIFNDYKDGKFISRIINVHTKEIKTICKAIYAVHPSGEYSISMNFERCSFTRAYSYAPKVDDYWSNIKPKEDAIIKVDLRKNTFEEIISLDKVIENSKQPINSNKNWFEHIMLNPSGNRFSFYHRFGDENKFSTRNLTSDLKGENIWIHPNKDTERLSHLGWLDDDHYVIYTIPQTKLNEKWVGKPMESRAPKWYVTAYRKIVKPFIPRKIITSLPKPEKFYALTIDQKDIIGKINPCPKNMDGHPSFTKDKKYMLTDTYADNDNYRHLLLYNLESKKTFHIGKFYSVYNDCGWRADLHPRFSPDESQVIIDTNHSGLTSIMVININWKSIRG